MATLRLEALKELISSRTFAAKNAEKNIPQFIPCRGECPVCFSPLFGMANSIPQKEEARLCCLPGAVLVSPTGVTRKVTRKNKLV